MSSCLSMSMRWTGACRGTPRSRRFCDGTSSRRSSPPASPTPCAACSIRGRFAPSRPTGSRDRSTDCFANSGIKSTPIASCAWSRAARPVTERRPTVRRARCRRSTSKSSRSRRTSRSTFCPDRFRARRRRWWARSPLRARPCSLRSGWRRFSVARSTSTPISSRAIGSTCCSNGSRARTSSSGTGRSKALFS